jgi:hypothetical protein
MALIGGDTMGWQRAMRCFCVVLLATYGALPLEARVDQQTTPHKIEVEGVTVRVWTNGLGDRTPGQPVIVLEAGSGADLGTWNLVFAELALLR